MRILLVALPDSIHTARWASQILDAGWDVRLFPSLDLGVVHPDLATIPVYHTLAACSDNLDRKLRLQHSGLFKAGRQYLGVRLLSRAFPGRRLRQLIRVMEEFRPDIIHSLEFQAAGYLVSSAKKAGARKFPPWIATNWGSDIYHFQHFPAHAAKIREVLGLCDYYSCECERDVRLARQFGFKGRALQVIPNAGGFDLEKTRKLQQPGPVSSRRRIALKGYQHWVGRALVGLAALEECAELLRGYEVVLHSASPETEKAAAAFRKKTGVSVTLLPKGTPHEEVLAMYGRSRVAIGLSLSDGASTSFLEGLVMGALPVQSWTACADEWITDGLSGLLVPPEDSGAVAAALKRALTDDSLVDTASRLNAETAEARLNLKNIRDIALGYYRTVAGEKGIV